MIDFAFTERQIPRVYRNNCASIGRRPRFAYKDLVCLVEGAGVRMHLPQP